jgi:hypothetical protein
VSFLENLTSDSLGLSAEEFDRYMSGKSIPFASLQAGVMVSEVFAFFKKKKKKSQIFSLFCIFRVYV